MTWREAIKKTNPKLFIAMSLICAYVSYVNSDAIGLYWLGFVWIGYIIGVVGTKYRWRGFI